MDYEMMNGGGSLLDTGERGSVGTARYSGLYHMG
jgi:hypothetical protein